MTSYQIVPTVQPVAAGPERGPSKTDVSEETQKLNGDGAREELFLSPLPPQTKVYRRRWLMLIIFVLVSMSSAFQWIQFSIITNLIMKYYNVDSTTVDWTSLVYMVTYVRIACDALNGRFWNGFGSWIKVLGAAPDLFYVALIGQTVTAMSQVFILGVPPNVAAVWFGAEQVSSACSIGVFGNQLGVALGFFLPPMMVQDHENIEDIGADLKRMFYIVAGTCTAFFLLVLVAFQAKPPLPPNAARAAPQSAEPVTYYQSIKTIVTNRNYILLLITYGINAGVFYAMSTLLNQTVLKHFPGEEENAGRIGLTIVVCGMLGSVVCGIVLDKTHKFRETTLVVYGLAVAGMVAYTFTFELQYIVVTFVTAGAVGFFMTGYLPVGFEFAAELTYPEPEVTSSGLLNASAQVFGIVFTIMGGWLLNSYGDLVCNGILSAALFVGAVLTFFIRSDLRRQRANQMEALRLNEPP
ncbi:hypothetical protein GHT06_016621 [Daphnia sinensis]|uniref:Choline/ethanolamine transporter FLVCR1 n=1 Tax=Daphnia sinensis TaxID=1820382 RepID=A0AAD5PU57_9CRUS|nr:hypothetical protein GHT06_016621 [Daphnia sinensis]